MIMIMKMKMLNSCMRNTIRDASAIVQSQFASKNRMISSIIFFSFSIIQNNMNYRSSPKRNPNIQINHKIQDCRDLKELFSIHSSSQHQFNFINYSTLYKRLAQFGRSEILTETLDSINSALYLKILSSEEWHSGDSSVIRSVAQLSFYLSKIQENNSDNKQSHHQIEELGFNEKQQKISESKIENMNTHQNDSVKSVLLQDMLDKQGERLFSSMNQQEKANFLYQLAKRNKSENITKLLNQIEDSIANPQQEIQLRFLLSMFYSLTISKVEALPIYQLIDSVLLNLLKSPQTTSSVSARDFSDLLFCYSKNQKILSTSAIFSLIEKAAAFPLNQNFLTYQSSNKNGQQPQKFVKSQNKPETDQNQQKTLNLFQNDHEIDPLSISGMLSAIANFEENKFSYDFYERLENVVLLTRFRTTRQLANSFRGIAQFYIPSDTVYVHMERQAMYFFSKRLFDKDLHSFSTMLYFFAMHSKGSLKFYQACEEFSIQHLKEFNQRQLNFIFFSFKFSLHYSLSRNNKDILVDHLLSIFHTFSPWEISSILTNFRHFEDDNSRRMKFFLLLGPKIDSINVDQAEPLQSLHLLTDIFKTFFEQDQKMSIPSTLPTLTKQLEQIIDKLEKNKTMSSQTYIKDLKHMQSCFLDCPQILSLLEAKSES